MIGAATQRIATFATARSIRVWENLETDAIVAGERDLMERVFLSLLHNAVKYAREGGNVWISGHSTGSDVCCCIRDDGPGFTADGLLHAFDRFWRDNAARDTSGSGLGLTVARTVLERSGGTIAIDNAPGGGAMVTIHLPAARIQIPTPRFVGNFRGEGDV